MSSTITLIVILVILVLALLILPFSKELMKDKQELRATPIEKKFKVMIDEINKAFLDGKGEVFYPVKEDPRWINLHSNERANYLIQFNYSTGNLTVYLNYKYFYKELKANVPFYNVRDIDAFTQKHMANEFIQKMKLAIRRHQESISVPESSSPSAGWLGDDEQSSFGMISDVYNGLSIHQKKSIINMGYRIFSADGSSWSDFVSFSTVRTELNTLNLDWRDCKQQLDTEGEGSIYSDLRDLESGVYDMTLMFWMSLINTEDGPSEERGEAFFRMNERLGHSQKDVEQHIEIITALMKMYGV